MPHWTGACPASDHQMSEQNRCPISPVMASCAAPTYGGHGHGSPRGPGEVWVQDPKNWRAAWRIGRALVLGTAIITASVGVATIIPSTTPTVAEASVASGNKDNDKDKDQKDKHDKGGDHDE